MIIQFLQGSLGISSEENIMEYIMNLVDFYIKNNITEKRKVCKENLVNNTRKCDNRLIVEEPIPEYQTIFPITALKSGVIKFEVAELLYRQFSLGVFSSYGDQAKRYEAARDIFGEIIGLTRVDMDNILRGIGETIYQNYIRSTILLNRNMVKNDMLFVAKFQKKLNLSPEESKKMLLNAEKKILLEEADNLLGENPRPEFTKIFLARCNSMGIDLEADIGISKVHLIRMVEEEISSLFMNDKISFKCGRIFSEIQETINLSPQEAQKLFRKILIQRAKAMFAKIRSQIWRGREKNIIQLIECLIQWAQFVNGELDLDVDEATGWKIYNIYDTIDVGEKDPLEIDSKKKVLKRALCLFKKV